MTVPIQLSKIDDTVDILKKMNNCYQLYNTILQTKYLRATILATATSAIHTFQARQKNNTGGIRCCAV